MKQRVISFISVICICSLSVSAQNKSAIKQYYEFRSKVTKEYDDFRNECNKIYVDFVRKAWKEYQMLPAIPVPKKRQLPPVVFPEEKESEFMPKDISNVIPVVPSNDDKEKKEEEVKKEEGQGTEDDKEQENDTPINSPEDIPDEVEEPLIEVIPLITPEPQPLPVAPVYEEPQPVEQYFIFEYCGTTCKVRLNETHRFTIDKCSENEIADIWEFCSGSIYNNVIRDCLELRIRHSLCDWAYLQMLQTLGESFFGKGSNEATLLTAYLYCQSGYKMRLAHDKQRLYLLLASKHTIYKHGYFTIEGENYYMLEERGGKSLYVCEAAFPKEQALSLWMSQLPTFAVEHTDHRLLQSKRYPSIQAEVYANKNLLTFFDSYPASEIGGNIMTNWAMYAQTPLCKETTQNLYPTLRKQLKGLTEYEAANRLLNFVQTAFEYELDDIAWGEERTLFAEETMFYPYCDCEDRSILYSHLVRDLLGLDVALVYYPGHLTTAVCFKEEVEGDYITIDNRHFVICDPTYINASVGECMPMEDTDNAQATVLKRNHYEEDFLVELGDNKPIEETGTENNNSGSITLSNSASEDEEIKQSLFPICIDDKYGYQNANGDIIVPCKYDSVSGYKRGDKFPYAAHKEGLITLYCHEGMEWATDVENYIPLELNKSMTIVGEDTLYTREDYTFLVKYKNDSVWKYIWGLEPSVYYFRMTDFDMNNFTYNNNVYCTPIDTIQERVYAKKFFIVKEKTSNKYGIIYFNGGRDVIPYGTPFIYDNITFVKGDKLKVEVYSAETGERKVISLME